MQIYFLSLPRSRQVESFAIETCILSKAIRDIRWCRVLLVKLVRSIHIDRNAITIYFPIGRHNYFFPLTFVEISFVEVFWQLFIVFFPKKRPLSVEVQKACRSSEIAGLRFVHLFKRKVRGTHRQAVNFLYCRIFKDTIELLSSNIFTTQDQYGN